ncbi:GyrI-like domain-containing protein [Sphaerochaeta sp.]|uniref:GyrI-like domain-containing protein n=1 Tax=Sphaerochaeta sp. TaxID=1972642 RepID=UPI002FC910C4
MQQYDLRSVYKHLYQPKTEPSVVEVPSLNYIVLDGEGDPEEDAYTQAVDILFSISDGLREEFGQQHRYKPFVVAPLECVWTAVEVENRRTWQWSAMIAQPDWVDALIFSLVRDEVAFRKGVPTENVRLCSLVDGLCVTLLHLGSYETENQSFEKMEAFCRQQNLTRTSASHREIYLDHPRQGDEQLLKTILRFTVR